MTRGRTPYEITSSYGPGKYKRDQLIRFGRGRNAIWHRGNKYSRRSKTDLSVLARVQSDSPEVTS